MSSPTSQPALAEAIDTARATLDAHVREIVQWHFSPETGCPFWLRWARENAFEPASVEGFEDLLRFPNFQDEWLREVPNEDWVPKAYAGKPFLIFETGGTTGLPKQRVSWNDHLYDYTEFAAHLPDAYFPRNGNWLMLGPTGPRRLRLSIEHLAHERGGSCYFTDLDARWVKKLLQRKDYEEANRYGDHVVAQGVELLKHRNISCLFTTPKLLEGLAERISIPGNGIRGVFCGGTTMSPQTVRFLVEEVLESKALLVPTYGNTLMGLARSRPLTPEANYSITYHAPQPRAVLRIVDKDDTDTVVPYETVGRVELSTLTREFFMPRFLERDEAIRREPWPGMPWDGVGEVRPLGAMEKKIVEGVY
jgi:phenylacetate-coenzyme A ligase PaaK-like adenylate-forming protein